MERLFCFGISMLGKSDYGDESWRIVSLMIINFGNVAYRETAVAQLSDCRQIVSLCHPHDTNSIHPISPAFDTEKVSYCTRLVRIES